MKRTATETQRQAGSWECPYEPLLDSYPQLAQSLEDCFWDDGKARTTYALKIQLYGPGCQVTVIDESQRRSCYTNAKSVSEAFGLIEQMLASGDLPWRSWGGKGR